MKSLTIIILVVLFATSGSVIVQAAESVESTDISDIFQVPLESGEIFTLPYFLPGLDEEDEHPDIPVQVPEKKEVIKKEVQGIQKKSVSKKGFVVVTAYSSTADQTDASPCITANGFNVCEHNRENVIAANFLPFGTRVRLPDIYGEKVFTVQDRMHRRHSSRVDIWMKTRNKAKQFGVKHSKVEIVPEQVALQQ